MEAEKADEKLTILQGQRKLLHERLKLTYSKLLHARNLYHQMEERYWKQKCEFEQCDRELAMIDGRYQVIPLGGIKKEPKIELSQSQILDIARKLGIEVRMNEPSVDGEDEE